MPADFADEAQQINEIFLEKSLKSLPKASVPFSGLCLHCEEPVTERRYCDKDCREAYETSQRRSARMGPTNL